MSIKKNIKFTYEVWFELVLKKKSKIRSSLYGLYKITSKNIQMLFDFVHFFFIDL